MFVQLFRDKSYVRSQHLLLMHQSRRPWCLWGEKFLPEPCGDQFTSQSKGLCYGLGGRKTGLDLHQSKKTTPPPKRGYSR